MPEEYPIIRKFEPGDIEEILAIERQAFPKTAYSRELLLQYGVHYPETFVVMETGEGIAGYIIFDRSGHIHSTAVKAAQRRRGFGTRLFRYALNHVERRAWLEVRSRNTGAVAFYQAMGMRVSGSVPNYYGKDDALVMVLNCVREDFSPTKLQKNHFLSAGKTANAYYKLSVRMNRERKEEDEDH